MTATLTNLQTIATLIGHKGRCFDLRCYLCPNDQESSPTILLLSSSEDGTVKLWNPAEKKCLHTLTHNKNAEVLRSTAIGNLHQSSAFVCTAGSDGKACIWKVPHPLAATGTATDNAPMKISTLSHRSDESQIYACESHPLLPEYLLTGADNELRVWDLSHETTTPCNQWDFFLPALTEDNDRVHFGGDYRNPNRESYVFDAKWHSNSPTLLSTILSDNSLKILDLRVKEIQCSLNFPSRVFDEEQQQYSSLGHPTSLNWIDQAPHKFATEPTAVQGSGNLCSISFGSGHLGLLDMRKMELLSLTKIHHRASYGSFTLPISNSDEVDIVSWASDQSICHWSYKYSSISKSVPSSSTPDQEENNSSEEEEGGEVSIKGMFELASFSPLVCCSSPVQANLFYCGGEMRSSQPANSHNKGLSFLGTPIYVCQLPSVSSETRNDRK